jgi:hypothetical protein
MTDDQLVAWMRHRGVVKYERGDLKITLGPEPPPKRDEHHESEEQREKRLREMKRRKYEQEFGRQVSDGELERLP